MYPLAFEQKDVFPPVTLFKYCLKNMFPFISLWQQTKITKNTCFPYPSPPRVSDTLKYDSSFIWKVPHVRMSYKTQILYIRIVTFPIIDQSNEETSLDKKVNIDEGKGKALRTGTRTNKTKSIWIKRTTGMLSWVSAIISIHSIQKFQIQKIQWWLQNCAIGGFLKNMWIFLNCWLEWFPKIFEYLQSPGGMRWCLFEQQ